MGPPQMGERERDDNHDDGLMRLGYRLAIETPTQLTTTPLHNQIQAASIVVNEEGAVWQAGASLDLSTGRNGYDNGHAAGRRQQEQELH